MKNAPSNSLPTYDDCLLRVENKKYLEEKGALKDGKLLDDFYIDSRLPNPVHEFIYEYDDADPYKSAWFLHRLELLINFIKNQ